MMNSSNAKGSMYVTTSTTSSRKAAAEDQFPAGLRVMVVDDDPTCLMILEKMLRTCLYEVTKCNRAEIALSLLRKNRDGFDVVISDVHMPDMDGFQLLVDIGLEMDLPVIMMSADDSQHVVMKGVTHGACDYLIKPVRIEALKNIWQHVVRRKKNEWKDFEQSGNGEEGERQPKVSEEADYSSSANEGNWKSSKRRKEDEDEADDREDSSTLKKPRVVWSVELHQQFVAAVNQLGIDKAVPKKILELMNVPGLTRENVASHLQKYRLYLRRLSGVTQQSNLGSSFVTPQDAAFGPLSSLHGLDFQALAATGQFQAQSLATLQAAGMGRSVVKSGVPMSIIDQRNIFSFDNPKLRYGESQHPHMSSSKQMNLLHGIPTTMEPKQLVHMHHPSAQPVRHMNIQVSREQGGQNNALLMQMAQPQSRTFGETTNSNASRIPSSLGQTMLSNGIAANVSTRSGIPENVGGTGYNQALQNTSLSNYSINCTPEPPRNSLPLGSTTVIPPLTTKGASHEEVKYDIKESSGGLIPSYDVFEELQQHKPSNWDLHNVGLSFDGSQHLNSVQSNVGLAPSVLGHVAFPSNQMTGENRSVSVSSGGKVILSAGYNPQNGSTRTVSHHLNTTNMDNFMRVKAEAVSDVHPNLFGEQFGQDDLMSALLKQQGSSGAAQNEFDFDGFSMDNIPV